MTTIQASQRSLPDTSVASFAAYRAARFRISSGERSIVLGAPIGSDARCRTDEELTSRLEGSLKIDFRESFDAHVEQCPSCQRRLNEIVNHLYNDSDLTTSWVYREISSTVERASPETVLKRLRGSRQLKPEFDRQFAEGLCLGDKPLRFVDYAGEGGMAVVFRCREDSSGQDVAVKVLRHHYVANPDIRRQFRQEAEIQARLAQAGAADVFETGELEDGRLYTIMRYCEGRTLSQRMQVRRRSYDDRRGMIGIFRRVCEILASAHQQGIRHRDLKPSNIHVSPSGDVTILDWGLAQDSSEGELGEVSSGSATPESDGRHEAISGTPGYIAPEQLRGDKSTASADVYSLGVILSELLTGSRIGTNESSVPELADHQKTRNEILRRVRVCRTDKSLSELVERCIATNPSERPKDAGELLSELDRLAGRLPGSIGSDSADSRDPASIALRGRFAGPQV